MRALISTLGAPWRWLAATACFALFYAMYFAPVWTQGVELAPGDGILYYMPFFLAPLQMWSPLMLSGYSAIGDPQSQLLYPLRLLAPTFNVYVVSAYVVAAVGTAGLVLRLTRSRAAAACAALVMSGSGFMMAHLGHVSIVHAAAWAPCVLWACVEVRESEGWRAVALGAMAVALVLLGGHPQASLLGLLLAAALALHAIVTSWRRSGLRVARVLALRYFAMFAIGILLAAPMLVPALNAAAESVRGEWTRQDFDSFRHSPSTLRMLAFPNMWGAITQGPYGGYAGPGSPAELAVYVGFLPLFLAIAAVADRGYRAAAGFWAGACIVAFLLTMGTATPLGELVYHLPVIGRFRAQARFGLVTTIALCVLAGYGIAALMRNSPSRPHARRLVLVAAVLCIVFVVSVALFPPTYPGRPTKTWAHPALWSAPALMVASLVAFALLVYRPGRAAVALVILVAVIDVGSFGWFFNWRYAPQAPIPAKLETDAQRVVGLMSTGEGRVYPVDASSMSVNPLRPNVNIAYGIASVAGYTPLLPQRYASFTGADTSGNLPTVPSSAPLMDVLAVRWLTGGVSNAQSQLLGAGCGVASEARRLRARLPANGLGSLRVASHMACSYHLPTGAGIATVRIIGSDGTSRLAGTLRAGIETAEWAYDRPDIRAVVIHARPRIAEPFQSGDAQGLWFGAEFPVNVRGDPGAVVEIALDDGVAVPLRLRGVDFVHADTGKVDVLALTPSFPGEEQALNSAVTYPPLPPVSERRRYNGMVWALCAAHTAPAEAIMTRLRAAGQGVKGGFDASREALIETGVEVPALSCKEPPTLEIRGRGAGTWTVAASGKGSALLVVSERYDVGWRARVDGAVAPVIPVDGLVLGVNVPEGEHVVELRYRPGRFAASTLAFALGALACAWLLAFGTLAPGALLTRLRAKKA